MAAKHSGYTAFSQLKNADNFESRINISKDSVFVFHQIALENHLELRIPNENIDSMVRELNDWLNMIPARQSI